VVVRKKESEVKAVKALFWSSRPISWINTAFPFFAVYLFVTESIDTRLIIGTVFFLIPYNLLMYGINDVFDYQSDIRNPRKGGIEGALLDPKFHSLTIYLSIALAAVFIVFLLLLGSDVSDLWLLVSVFSVLAYSVPKLRFKEVPLLDSITSALHFVTPMLFGLALAGVNLSNPLILKITFGFMLWGIGSHAFGAVQDILADRAAGIRSIATKFGAKGTVRFSFVSYLLSGIMLISLGFPGSLAAVATLPYLAIITPYLNLTDLESEKANAGWKKFIWLNFLAGAIVSLILFNYKQG
jgi:4-hydroxybenzoate polyprenyltransferase